MSRRRRTAKVALGTQLLVVVLVASLVRPGFSEPGSVLTSDVPIVGGESPKAREVKDGDATVSTQTGAFQYTYPIPLPPGRLGVAPNLALRYSSQGAVYGDVAAGWTLDLPEIKSDASDSLLAMRRADGTYARNFVSSLAGGHRLVPVSVPPPSGVVGSFRAEDDSSYAHYERLTNNRWRVRTPDGMTHMFNESDHLTDASGSPVAIGLERRAPLTSTTDPFGNTVHYYWRLDSRAVGEDDVNPALIDELFILHIDYTANAAAGLAPFASVGFSYQPPQYCAGSELPKGALLDVRDRERFRSGMLRGARQLDQITVNLQTGGTPVRRSETVLGYDPDALSCGGAHGTMRLLTSITQRGFRTSGAVDELPPVTFDYGEIERGFDQKFSIPLPSIGPTALQYGNHTVPNQPNASFPTLNAMFLDLDGDGRLDRLESHPTDSSSRTVFWSRNTTDPVTGELTWAGGTPFLLPELPDVGSAVVAESFSLSGQVKELQNVEVPPDLTITLQDHWHIRWTPADRVDLGETYVCTAAPNYSTYLVYRFLDMDADGRPDLVTGINNDPIYYQPFPNADAPAGHPELLAAWDLGGSCAVDPLATDDYACPDVEPAQLDSAMICVDRTDMCEPNVPVLDEVMLGADHTTCDVINGGVPLVAMSLTSGGLWADEVGARRQDPIQYPHPNNPFSEPDCSNGRNIRPPAQHCRRYPWRWYRNTGNGSFDHRPTLPVSSSSTRPSRVSAERLLPWSPLAGPVATSRSTSTAMAGPTSSSEALARCLTRLQTCTWPMVPAASPASTRLQSRLRRPARSSRPRSARGFRRCWRPRGRTSGT